MAREELAAVRQAIPAGHAPAAARGRHAERRGRFRAERLDRSVRTARPRAPSAPRKLQAVPAPELHVWGSSPDFVGPRHALRERLLFDLLLGGRPGPRVLDVGAGQGTFSLLLAARGFDVVAVDESEPAVAVLRERVSPESAAADAAALPFAGESFDAVVLAEVLEHLESDVAALREAARVLRPGGVLAVSVPADRGRPGPSDEWAGHRRRYTRAGLLGVCAEAGFEVDRCLAWGFPFTALYHRHVYERYLGAAGPAPATGWRRRAGQLLGLVLQVDRAFVGVERGSLGYLLRARRV